MSDSMVMVCQTSSKLKGGKAHQGKREVLGSIKTDLVSTKQSQRSSEYKYSTSDLFN